ncbi:hypothetical protein ACWF62_14775 [Rhodococcus sp. NPDC054953]
MSTSHPRPDLAASSVTARMTTPELVAALRELLGATLVAYIGKVRATRIVREWAEGTRPIDDESDIERFRIAYRAARLITARDEPQVAQTWFQGLNPILDDRPPALLLREGDVSDVGPRVLSAARHFAGNA